MIIIALLPEDDDDDDDDDIDADAYNELDDKNTLSFNTVRNKKHCINVDIICISASLTIPQQSQSC